jgi:hypothetical protein
VKNVEKRIVSVFELIRICHAAARGTHGALKSFAFTGYLSLQRSHGEKE